MKRSKISPYSNICLNLVPQFNINTVDGFHIQGFINKFCEYKLIFIQYAQWVLLKNTIPSALK